MKKTKIAAFAMAAVTAVSAAQAVSITASADAREHTLVVTSLSQESREQPSTMAGYIARWKRSGEFRNGIYWSDRTDRMTSGYVFAPGFGSNNISGISKGDLLTGEACLARKLAENYYETNTFMQAAPNARYFQAQIGDQYKLTCGNKTKYVFVYELPSESNNYKLKVVEVVNNRVNYDQAYTSGCTYLYKGNETWHIEYFTRPIKQGDANCDGLVYSNYTPMGGSDTDALNYIYQNGLPGTIDTYEGYLAMIYACSLNMDWYITQNDVDTIRYNNASGKMNGYWRYVGSM